MKKYLLPQNGNFYKANLHCHTDISDGKLSPAEVKEKYKALGYSAVCYTDHEVLIGHKDLCDEDFIALHGYEVAIKKSLDGHTGLFMPVYHFNFIAEDQDNLCMPRYFADNPSMPGNAKEWLDKYGVYDKNDTIDTTVYSIDWLNTYLPAVRDAGFLITYNHPQWSLQSSIDYLGLDGLHAIETMNTGCFGQGDCSTIHFREMLRYGMKVVPVGGDDNHSGNQIGYAWTMIKAPELTYDALIKAYKNGDSYASTGPEINELYFEDGKLFISTSPASSITLRGEGRYVTKARDCSSAQIAITPECVGKYFHVEVTGIDGTVAYTRAYSLDELK
ncbi:MAG: hypothetical protein IJ011_06615 [Clostridia bacterium]|nr:hypothetical protein [Clostridia bacterium]